METDVSRGRQPAAEGAREKQLQQVAHARNCRARCAPSSATQEDAIDVRGSAPRQLVPEDSVPNPKRRHVAVPTTLVERIVRMCDSHVRQQNQRDGELLIPFLRYKCSTYMDPAIGNTCVVRISYLETTRLRPGHPACIRVIRRPHLEQYAGNS